MSSGVYGIKRGADVDLSDIEVFLHYTPSRTERVTTITKLNPSDVILKNSNPNSTSGFEIFGGLYTLKLPVSTFFNKGFYTIYIKPIEIRTKITDVGVLSAQPGIRGLIFDLNTLDSAFLNKFQNNNLVGYRIEYLNNSVGGTDRKINNLFRIVTSNNKAEPVNQNLNNTNQKAIRYRFNDNASFVFATVTPNSPNSARPNINPFIGEATQDVIITNTFFDPIMLEIEMVDYDIEDLAIGMFGPQTKSLEDGIYTIYNFDNEIYKQFNLYEIKDRFDGRPLFEVREPKTSIDLNKDFDTITNV